METLLNGSISYLVIIDPLGVAMIFSSLVRGADRKYVRLMAMRSVAISFILVVLFGFFGQELLEQLGIAIESFRIAGGLLLFYTAFHMVTGDDRPTDKKRSTEVDISVFPMSIPLMAGPGCLTMTVLLFASAKQAGEVGYLLLAVATVYLVTLAALLFSGKVSRLVGETGNSILKRLFGVLLAALSIQFIVDGVRGFVVG